MTIEIDQTAPKSGAAFTVRVDDNFHYMDENERYTSGQFTTLEEAIAKAKKIVLDDLNGMFKPGMSSSLGWPGGTSGRASCNGGSSCRGLRRFVML